MLARRMLTFFVLLLVVTALSAGLAAPRRQLPPTAPTSPRERPSGVVARTIDTARSRPRTVTVRTGDLLTLTVRAHADDAVELEGLAALRAISPETPVVFDVLADAPGDYPVVLVGPGRTLGTVRVVSRRG